MRLSNAVMVVCTAVAVEAVAESNSYVLARKGQAEITFTVEAPLDTITGVSNGVVGAAHLDLETGQATARMVCDLNGFQTGIDLRDEDLRDQFFETGKYPSAVLEITKVDWKEKPAAGGPANGTATATLNLHGVTKNISMPVSGRLGELGGKSALTMRGSFDVKLADYNIQRPRRLFLKLGDTAHVVVVATLISTTEAKPAVAAATPAAEAPAPIPAEIKRAFIPVAQAIKAKPAPPKFKFAANTIEGKGERLLAEPKIGGPGNVVACQHCHANVDERAGIYINGIARPSHTLFDAAKRPTLWQGISKTPGKASSLCAKLFMRSANGLTADQEAQLDAYLKAIAPNDTVPEVSYATLALSRRSELAKMTEGNRKEGEALEKKFCGDCHGKGKVRPPLTAGLYEPDYIVRRVRWLPGHDARQMPPMYVDRLVDSDLRNIVTYLAGDQSKRIFERKNSAK